ncbi:MAG: hypothetical protein ICV60_22850 [Pyrinomonadaceae bacterium]|nr:hypothetical protein [Pyrinomonadaceae bacterium]
MSLERDARPMDAAAMRRALREAMMEPPLLSPTIEASEELIRKSKEEEAQAEQNRLEEERLRAEDEAKRRAAAEQEAGQSAEQMEQKLQGEQEQQADNGEERQDEDGTGSGQVPQPIIDPPPGPPPPRNYRILYAIIGAIVLIAFGSILFYINSEGEDKRPTNTQKALVPTSSSLPANNSGTSRPSPTSTPNATPPNTNSTMGRALISTISSADTVDGSRVTIASDSALDKYTAYSGGDRFYVVIVNAQLSGQTTEAAQNSIKGKGFQSVKIDERGSDFIISFRIAPGAKARVEQKSNRLDVIFTL